MQDANEVVIAVANLNLTNLCFLMVLSLMTASLAHFIQYCLKPGEIFGALGVRSNYLWIKWRPKDDQWKRFFIKPLLCVYCMGAHISIITFLILRFYSDCLPLGQFAILTLLMFLTIGLNYVFTSLISKVL